MLKQQAINVLKKYRQEGILNILNRLPLKDRDGLIRQILKTDFEEVNNLYKELKNGSVEEINSVEPVGYVNKEKINEKDANEYNNLGEEVIKNNKLAVITVAGGQGTRLGHSGPKGTYMLDLEKIYSKKVSIFEVLSKNFLNAKKEHNVDINWYIMTSNENKGETVQFFKNNNFFGLNEKNIIFFVQNDIPIIDENGKVLIGSNHLIKTASNGNGGIYEVLDKQGILNDMKQKGIEWVYLSGVDNILANPIDKLFIGLTIKENNLIASKTTKKIDPNESVGVFCKKNGKIGVIEYSEISEELRCMVDENGKLVYGESNILSHLYNIRALEILKSKKLKYHRSHKKGSYINKDLEEIYPIEPNIYKFEKFIFDAFAYFEDMTILSINREEEFAPIKNAEGKDSPRTAVELYVNKFNKNRRFVK